MTFVFHCVFFYFHGLTFAFHRSVSASDDVGGGSGNLCLHLRGRILKTKKRNGCIHSQIGSVRCGPAHWGGSKATPPLSKSAPLRVRQTTKLTKTQARSGPAVALSTAPRQFVSERAKERVVSSTSFFGLIAECGEPALGRCFYFIVLRFTTQATWLHIDKLTPHQCWNVCDWVTTEKDQPSEAQLPLPTCTHFRLWPSHFRKGGEASFQPSELYTTNRATLAL